MRRKDTSAASTEDLVARFEQCALQQDDAVLRNANAKYNRLYREMDAIRNELKARPGDQRSALLPLYAHPNPQVRLKAAVSTLAVAPREARAALEYIIAAREFPQAGDAGMTLLRVDRGEWVPT